LFELVIPKQFPPRKDPIEGVLGKIPSHSVKAPRPLLQIKEDQEIFSNSTRMTTSKSYKILMSIENAINYLLEVEDIDLLLKNNSSANYFNLTHLKQQRELLTHSLFNALHVYVLPPGKAPPQVKIANKTISFALPQDEVFLGYLAIRKGIELIVRAFPVLFHSHVLSMFFCILRNLAYTTSQPIFPESTKFFDYLVNITNAIPPPQTVLALQTLAISHSGELLAIILQTKYGYAILKTLFKKGNELENVDHKHLWKDGIEEIQKKN